MGIQNSMRILYMTSPPAVPQLTYCPIVFPFFLNYLMNTERMISSWPVMFKPTQIIPMMSAYSVYSDMKRDNDNKERRTISVSNISHLIPQSWFPLY
jgi:hypothetical protein